MEFTEEDVMQAIETLDGLQPSWYDDILDNGTTGDEQYVLHGDDVATLVHAIYVLKTYHGIV